MSVSHKKKKFAIDGQRLNLHVNYNRSLSSLLIGYVTLIVNKMGV